MPVLKDTPCLCRQAMASSTNECGTHDLWVTSSLVHYISKSQTLSFTVSREWASGGLCIPAPTLRLTLMSKMKSTCYWSELRTTNSKYFMLINPAKTKRLLLLLLLLMLLLLLFVISCMQGIYNHIPETNLVSTAIPTAQVPSFGLQHFLQCALFLVQLFYVLNLPNVLLVTNLSSSLNLFLLFRWLTFYRYNHKFHTAHSCHHSSRTMFLTCFVSHDIPIL